jgi:predicted glycosyltransferase
LRGFPISQTFNAFDFSIAAAGYNTFHEVIALQLPTIFIADRHPSMDDQGGRAEFAQNHSLGFDLIEDDISLLPALCNALLQPKANEFLRQQCGGIDDTNGAVQAANLIKTTVDGQ